MDEKKKVDIATPHPAAVDEDFAFSIDLVQKSKEHIAFLQSLHSQGVTLQRPSPKSLQRYRDIWVPLVHAHPHQQLVPPADCAWLWHCHRLAPFRYVFYLKSRFGLDCHILEPHPAFTFQLGDEDVCYGGAGEESDMKELAETTRTLWDELHPQETFFLRTKTSSDDADGSSKKHSGKSLLLDGLDLLASTERQVTFLWQISGPSFLDDVFLQDGKREYYKFLKLRERPEKDNVVLVPTYQIDLMWHTHILSNLSGYFMDCKAIMGNILNHDDSLNERTADGPLDRSFKGTKALWKESYGEDYFVKGGMYRGEPPKAYYCTSWSASEVDDSLHQHIGPDVNLMIGPGGASSTNSTGGTSDQRVIWTWREILSQMKKHPKDSMFGDLADCWIKYDASANSTLETAFQGQGGEGGCDLGNGYTVDLHAMKQTKTSTGYKREVQRHVAIISTIEAAKKVWCWQETDTQMSMHHAESFYGDPANCWIKYDDDTNAELESAFQTQGKKGECSPSDGYTVNFETMKQTKISTGFHRDVQRVDPLYNVFANTPWTPIDGAAPDGLPAFIAVNPKSQVDGVDTRTMPFKKNYIFGRRGGKWGYYHITTKEGYEVLTVRIRFHINHKGKKTCSMLCPCVTLFGTAKWYTDREAELEHLRELRGIIAARSDANAPTGMVGLPSHILTDPQKRSQHYSDTGEWYFPDEYYNAGGGCGAAKLADCGGAVDISMDSWWDEDLLFEGVADCCVDNVCCPS
jgi:hypothetical protein